MPDNNFTDEFELQFTNEAFNDTEYINYAGSREVGIDVGPFDQEIVYTSSNQRSRDEFSKNFDSTANLNFAMNEASQQSQVFAESAIDVPSPLLKANKLAFDDNFASGQFPNTDTYKDASLNDHLTSKYLHVADTNVNNIPSNFKNNKRVDDFYTNVFRYCVQKRILSLKRISFS